MKLSNNKEVSIMRNFLAFTVFLMVLLITISAQAVDLKLYTRSPMGGR